MSNARSIRAQPLAAMHPVGVSLRAGRPWFRSLRRLVRALRFRSPKEPQRPRISHPVDQLIFHNFAIYEMYHGQPGREYMSLNDVEVVRKVCFRELGAGPCEYRFELKAAPDSVWQSFFKRLVTDINVRFENKTMVLCCFPAELESDYEEIKNAVTRANAWHAEDREELLARINDQIEGLRVRRKRVELHRPDFIGNS